MTKWEKKKWKESSLSSSSDISAYNPEDDEEFQRLVWITSQRWDSASNYTEMKRKESNEKWRKNSFANEVKAHPNLFT